uniref:Cytochrome c oxidase assembly factor 7 n=1 Tax=Oncorhynchus tshawytscha TaxID=74940 RepID=A0AAZ3PLJ8_ONCTS
VWGMVIDEKEVNYQCHREKDPEGCQRLADYMEGVKENVESTTQVLKHNCEMNKHGEVFYKLGVYYMAYCFMTAYSSGGKKSVDVCQNVGLLTDVCSRGVIIVINPWWRVSHPTLTVDKQRHSSVWSC